jgi:hypothetical protein
VTFDPTIIAERLKDLVREEQITPARYAVAIALLWSCRPAGRDFAQVSMLSLAEHAGVGHSTAVDAVRDLRSLGLLMKQKGRRNVYRWTRESDSVSGGMEQRMT